MATNNRRTRGTASRAAEVPVPLPSIPALSVPSPLIEPRFTLADELSQAGAEQMENQSSYERLQVPSTSVPMQFTLAEPKPIEMDHLSVFAKLEEHFGKYYTRTGVGHYSTFLSQEIQEVLAFQFHCWLNRQPLTADFPRATSFHTAPRQLLQPFIKFYVNTEIKNDGAGRQSEVETN